jgi:carboxypeptidase PM20D1
MLDPSSKIPLFSISVAHKRALWLELELNIETSSHGSVTPKEYATKEMNAALYQVLKKEQKPVFTDLNVEVLKQLGKVQGGFKGWFLKHPKLFKPLLIPQLRKTPEMFSIFSNTITLTSIESYSEVINVIPSKVTARLDCRLLPTVSSEIFLAELTKKLGNDNIKIKILQSMPDIQSSNNNSIYYQSIDKAIKHTYPNSNVITILLPNFNDVGVFRQAGVPGFAISPVILEKKYLETIHNINERIPVSILAKGQEVYVHFINELLED